MNINDLEKIIFNKSNIYALYDDNRNDAPNDRSLILYNPIEHIIASNEDELLQAIEKIDFFSDKGFYVGGYISYEAGHYLVDKKIKSKKKSNDNNLLNFYVFKNIEYIKKEHLDLIFKSSKKNKKTECYFNNMTLNISRDSYVKAINKIKNYLYQGDTYQVNYTIKYRFDIKVDAIELYRKLRARQKVSYGAYLQFDFEKILSLSPELFIKKKGIDVTAKPMKGTAKRGAGIEDDIKIIDILKKDTKTISENVMIVDLLRNDLGRLCLSGSIKTENLFEVQTFETVHQMVSTVIGQVDKNIKFSQVIKEIFPCGSITGAPKIRTMEIIDELESEQRGVYTGAIGFILPNNDYCFNVPIRTIKVIGNKAEMGIGSGIVYESDANDEYDECLLKAKFLTEINS